MQCCVCLNRISMQESNNVDILTDLNRRLHGLRDHEHLTVPCADLKAWRDEVKRLREFEPHRFGCDVQLSAIQEKIMLAVQPRGQRGISRDRLCAAVYDGPDGGADSERITIRVHVYRLNLKLRPKGYEIRARDNDAWRYRLVKL